MKMLKGGGSLDTSHLSGRRNWSDRLCLATRGFFHLAVTAAHCLMQVLVIEDAIISVGGNDLLKEANLRVVPKQKIAVVGPNGAGKSTLIRACVGKLAPEGGRIVVSHGVHVGYLEQTAVSGSNRSVWEEAASRMDDINQAWAALEVSEVELDRAEANGLGDKEIEAVSNRLMQDQERLEAVGGYRKDEMIAG